MGEAAEDLINDFSENDEPQKEMCYCGRMVTEEERIFVNGKTICIYCQNE